VVNPELTRMAGLSEEDVDALASRKLAELERKEDAYRRGRPPLSLEDRTVILVDDGAATGSSMRAAALGLRRRGVAGIVAALPVASRQAVREILKDADEVVCVMTPEPFRAVGQWYRDFSEVTDEEVAECLEGARARLREKRVEKTKSTGAADPFRNRGIVGRLDGSRRGAGSGVVFPWKRQRPA
jgi:predicted phosphoribosyltransferase